jgi:hypothetical protein
MSAGAGGVRPSLERIHDVSCAGGAIRATVAEPVTFGSEQQLQSWQFGGHWPPETSVGQLSSQSVSSQRADSPLTLNVSSARKTTTRARRTEPGLHRLASIARLGALEARLFTVKDAIAVIDDYAPNAD